jgi:hypothetical protein
MTKKIIIPHGQHGNTILATIEPQDGWEQYEKGWWERATSGKSRQFKGRWEPLYFIQGRTESDEDFATRANERSHGILCAMLVFSDHTIDVKRIWIGDENPVANIAQNREAIAKPIRDGLKEGLDSGELVILNELF